ncbi:hypothetical protein GCM10011594_11010 [Nakamurella endophytica]|uniref:HTH marR-type domain-containing protein n=1 Tax=Nakamurella endophytica TaxID=1748367 RepID=A0A917SQX3_9ACTN|nr:hypothetical protein GCM10011594_11010 [Nakamurella endophytica]
MVPQPATVQRTVRDTLRDDRTAPEPVAADQVDAVLAASRVLVAVSARSLSVAEDRVTVGQFRVMVIVESRGPIGVNALAEAMGVHPSNATRGCDRLVAAGLLDRRENREDRRQLVLALTAAGRALLHEVMSVRRAAVAETLLRMPANERARVACALAAFAAAGGEPDPADLWRVGWTTATVDDAT